jgi:hypothetical protein
VSYKLLGKVVDLKDISYKLRILRLFHVRINTIKFRLYSEHVREINYPTLALQNILIPNHSTTDMVAFTMIFIAQSIVITIVQFDIINNKH